MVQTRAADEGTSAQHAIECNPLDGEVRGRSACTRASAALHEEPCMGDCSLWGRLNNQGEYVQEPRNKQARSSGIQEATTSTTVAG